jgi:hypothetical protein
MRVNIVERNLAISELGIGKNVSEKMTGEDNASSSEEGDFEAALSQGERLRLIASRLG